MKKISSLLQSQIDAPPNPLMDSIMNPKVKIAERSKSWGTFLGSHHFEGKRVCWSSGMGIKMNDK